MRQNARGDLLRLKDIICAIDAIGRHLPCGREEFDTNEMLRFFVLKHLEIVGEAASKITAALKEAYPNIAWSNIIGMRHILVHD
jgi:uncharacterized protein with HEPN domain